DHLRKKQRDEGERSGHQRGHRNEAPGADEVERRQQSEGQGTQAADEEVIFADSAGQDHSNEVSGENRLAARPDGQSAQSEEQEQEVLGLQLRYAPAVAPEEPL